MMNHKRQFESVNHSKRRNMILEIYMKITTLDTVRHYLLTFEGTSATQTQKHHCHHYGRNADTQV